MTEALVNKNFKRTWVASTGTTPSNTDTNGNVRLVFTSATTGIFDTFQACASSLLNSTVPANAAAAKLSSVAIGSTFYILTYFESKY